MSAWPKFSGCSASPRGEVPLAAGLQPTSVPQLTHDPVSPPFRLLAASGTGTDDGDPLRSALWSVFWTSWYDVIRIGVTAVLGYVLLVAAVRLFGKRTTSRMNNFDWIVTVAAGGIFASMVVLERVTLVHGGLAVGILFGGQFLLTTLTSRYGWARRVFLAPPTILFDGDYQRDVMRRERVSEAEIRSSMRESGRRQPEDVGAVVLESDAKLSVLDRGDGEITTIDRD